MNRATLFAEAFVRGFKIFVRDIVCPIFGLYLVLRMGQGAFEVTAIPIIGGIASALIGIPYWSRSDERSRRSSDANDGDDPGPRPRKKITIDSKGIRWGDDDGTPKS